MLIVTGVLVALWMLPQADDAEPSLPPITVPPKRPLPAPKAGATPSGLARPERPADRPRPVRSPPPPTPSRTALEADHASVSPADDEPAGCTPAASTVCHDGDVWSVDSCGDREGLTIECGPILCRDGSCPEPTPGDCDQESELGRCEANRVIACHAGARFEVDCAEHDRRCVETAEAGAVCASAFEDAPCDEEARCADSTTLEVCADDGRHVVDCGAHGASCDLFDGEARCVRVDPLPAAPLSQGEGDGCGPCGCDGSEPGPPSDHELCDGLDNTGDGRADDGADCGLTDIVAFVVTDARGGASTSDTDVALEVARINAHFAEGGQGTRIRFELADVVRIPREEWLIAEDADIQAIARAAATHPARDAFYIPVVFTDLILTGMAPKLGTATLPDGQCRGLIPATPMQVPFGAVVLSKGRGPSTAAHEVGHFLGLCHTHAATVDVAVRKQWTTGDGVVESVDCEACKVQGDRICDTPFDPGPRGCTFDPASCAPACADGSTPDVANLMSYYHGCRFRFSRAQGNRMRGTLAGYRARRELWEEAAGIIPPGGSGP